MRRVAAALLVAFVLAPGAVMGQEPSEFTLELRLGAGLGAESLGNTAPIEPEGYLTLGDVEAAPLVGGGLLLPAAWLGVRPKLQVTYALPADVGASWMPCDPGLACPSILLEPETTARRLDATAGVEFPILPLQGPVRLFGSAAAGVRWYGLSWDRLGEEGEALILPEGSHWESDFLVAVGGGASLSRGGWELTAGLDVSWSRFGPGTVTPDPEILALFADGIDLGRETISATTLSVGIRRGL